MRPQPENIDGRVVESHEFAHSVEHQVNWSHVLLAIVLVIAIFKLGPTVSKAASGPQNRERER